MDIDYEGLVQAPEAAEALAWLREGKSAGQRTITGSDGRGWWGAEAVAMVQKLYDLGATCVTAVEIAGRIEGARDQYTSSLVVELPGNKEKRAQLFGWQSEFAKELGHDSTPDEGQDYLLISRE
jgi:hypothetical protein